MYGGKTLVQEKEEKNTKICCLFNDHCHLSLNIVCWSGHVFLNTFKGPSMNEGPFSFHAFYIYFIAPYSIARSSNDLDDD